jgi:Sec-independent protein translocase protein TatA
MNGWVLGWSIGAVVVILVVALLGLMILGAARAAGQAEDILAALEEARDTTAGLWHVAETNQAATRIVDAATAAREALAAGEAS